MSLDLCSRNFWIFAEKNVVKMLKLSNGFDYSSNLDQCAFDRCPSFEVSSNVTRYPCVCGAFYIFRFCLLDFGASHFPFIVFIFLLTANAMERNYKEDQNNEIEALESIYCDDIEGTVASANNLFIIRIDLTSIETPFLCRPVLSSFGSIEHKSTQIQNQDMHRRIQSGG